MDDLYTPISDMPGDSGQSSSASGMIRNPLQKSRYAKNNDIIQKFAQTAKSHSSSKYKALKKAAPRWMDSIIRAEKLMADPGFSIGGSLTPAERKAAEDALARSQRILNDPNPYSHYGPNPHIPMGSITMDPRQAEAFYGKAYSEGVKDTMPAHIAAKEAERRAGIAEGTNIGVAQERKNISTYRRTKPYIAQSALKTLEDISPWPEMKTLGHALHSTVWKPFRAGSAELSAETKGAAGETLSNAQRAELQEAKKLGRHYTGLTPQQFKNKYDEYVGRYMDPTRGEENIADYMSSPEMQGAAPRGKTWSETLGPEPSMGRDFERIRQKGIDAQNEIDVNAAALEARKHILPALRNLGIKSGAGYLVYRGGKAALEDLWGGGGNNSSQPIVVPTPTSTQQSITVPTPTMQQRNEYEIDPLIPPLPGVPEQYGEPTPTRGPSGRVTIGRKKTAGMKKGGRFSKAGAKTLEQLLKEIEPHELNMTVPAYRTAAKGEIENILTSYGIDPLTDLSTIRAYRPDLDITDFTTKFPHGIKPVPAAGPATPPVSRARRAGAAAGRAAAAAKTWTSAAGKQFKNWVKNPRNAIALGATGATVGTLLGVKAYNAASDWLYGPNPASGDVGLPNTTYLPTMTPSSIPGAPKDNKPKATSTMTPTATMTPASAMGRLRQIKQQAKGFNVTATAGRKARDDRQKAAEQAIAIRDDSYRHEVLEPAIAMARNKTYDESYWNAQKPFKYVGVNPSGIINWTKEQIWGKEPPTYTVSAAGVKKRAKINKKSVPYQGSSYSQTAYVQPTSSSRFKNMAPEEQGAAMVNAIAENTRQSYRNTKESLNNLLRFASGAINAADKQTQFSNKVWPVIHQNTREFLDDAYRFTDNVIIPESQKAYRYTRDVAVPVIVQQSKEAYKQSKPEIDAAKSYVLESVDRIAQQHPELVSGLSADKLKSNLNRIVNKNPHLQESLKNFGTKLLKPIRKSMSKRSDSQMFTKRLENPTGTSGKETKNKYFN